MEPEGSLPWSQEQATGQRPDTQSCISLRSTAVSEPVLDRPLHSTCPISCPLYFPQVVLRTPSKSRAMYNISQQAVSLTPVLCREPVTAYSKYSQIPSTSVGCLPRPQWGLRLNMLFQLNKIATGLVKINTLSAIRCKIFEQIFLIQFWNPTVTM
jgi:hypothetical protein